MRVVSFILYLSFLLLSSKGNASLAETNTSIVEQFAQKHQVKHADDTHVLTLIEDIGVDFEEEIHSEKSTKTLNKIDFYKGKYSLVNTIYSLHPPVTISNYYIKLHEVFTKSNFGSCPIYLAHSVLII
ncbi:hypothetical protein [Flavobacterium sp.]|uniref:hypothetical protein n=1 Tax=Flavobacterium sp. TaxID=239 RepID=UPI00261126B2|nr:hypothetical protein [Flavobacterium sp.]